MDMTQMKDTNDPVAAYFLEAMNSRELNGKNFESKMKELGLGKDAPMVTNERGGKQSELNYRMDLVPPLALLNVAKVLKEGANKYDELNWKNITPNDHINHALCHLFALLAGDATDEHLAHAVCRLLFALDLVNESV